MKWTHGDREVFGLGTMVFTFFAMLLALVAVITAAAAYSHANDVSDSLAKVQKTGAIGSSLGVTLKEFSITPKPALVKAGKVTFAVKNTGSITHEMVVVRAPDATALPKVTVAGERAVGDVDEEAVGAANTIGETGDVKAGTTVTKTFNLSAGTYVLFCNIDNKNADGILNHFQRGMSASITVV